MTPGPFLSAGWPLITKRDNDHQGVQGDVAHDGGGVPGIDVVKFKYPFVF
jgi:hypothetical protein